MSGSGNLLLHNIAEKVYVTNPNYFCYVIFNMCIDSKRRWFLEENMLHSDNLSISSFPFQHDSRQLVGTSMTTSTTTHGYASRF